MLFYEISECFLEDFLIDGRVLDFTDNDTSFNGFATKNKWLQHVKLKPFLTFHLI